MTTTQEIGDTIEDIITDRLRVDRAAFDDTTRFDSETLDADSLDVVEMAEAIDANLDVYIPDEDLETLETVGDVKAYVQDTLE